MQEEVAWDVEPPRLPGQKRCRRTESNLSHGAQVPEILHLRGIAIPETGTGTGIARRQPQSREERRGRESS